MAQLVIPKLPQGPFSDHTKATYSRDTLLTLSANIPVEGHITSEDLCQAMSRLEPGQARWKLYGGRAVYVTRGIRLLRDLIVKTPQKKLIFPISDTFGYQWATEEEAIRGFQDWQFRNGQTRNTHARRINSLFDN